MSCVLVVPAGLREREIRCIGPGLCLLRSPDSDLGSGHHVSSFHDGLSEVPELGLKEKEVALLSEEEKQYK